MCKEVKSLMLDIIKTLLEHQVLVLIIPEVLKQQRMASRLPRPKPSNKGNIVCLNLMDPHTHLYNIILFGGFQYDRTNMLILFY